jgi:hypothetical protein
MNTLFATLVADALFRCTGADLLFSRQILLAQLAKLARGCCEIGSFVLVLVLLLVLETLA